MKLLKLRCLKWRLSRSRSKACASQITKLLPVFVHDMTLSVAASETMSYTLVRNGATSGGFGTGPTGAGAFPDDEEAAAEGGGEPLLEPMVVRRAETLASFETEAARETRREEEGGISGLGSDDFG